MKKLFACVFLLTVLDAAATAAGIKLGYLEEANPLISVAAEADPLAAGIAICLISGLLLMILYSFRHRIRWLVYAMSAVLAVKSFIICMHIYIVVSAMGHGYLAAWIGPFAACYFLSR